MSGVVINMEIGSFGWIENALCSTRKRADFVKRANFTSNFRRKEEIQYCNVLYESTTRNLETTGCLVWGSMVGQEARYGAPKFCRQTNMVRLALLEPLLVACVAYCFATPCTGFRDLS